MCIDACIVTLCDCEGRHEEVLQVFEKWQSSNLDWLKFVEALMLPAASALNLCSVSALERVRLIITESIQQGFVQRLRTICMIALLATRVGDNQFVATDCERLFETLPPTTFIASIRILRLLNEQQLAEVSTRRELSAIVFGFQNQITIVFVMILIVTEM